MTSPDPSWTSLDPPASRSDAGVGRSGSALGSAPGSAGETDALAAQPHARAVLAAAMLPGGSPSHAYLFHGPPGSGKGAVARAFAGALLAEGAREPGTVGERIARETHPDLTWVRPSGAAEMLVVDVEEPVVGAATRTPFESSRRVFVIEDAHTMNDQAANRMLKTLEEPAAFVHLVLLADRLEDVLPTIASRCQHVRFDPPSSEQIEAGLRAEGGGASDAALAACARLALGDARVAGRLASELGGTLRERAEGFVRGSLQGRTRERAWLGLLEVARAAGTHASEELGERYSSEAELLPAKEAKRHEREGADARRRAERRSRTETLALGLRLAELWLRDVWCLVEGVPELIYAVDREAELRADADGRDSGPLRAGIELVQETRARLAVNVAEELALEALAYRLQDLLAPSGAF